VPTVTVIVIVTVTVTAAVTGFTVVIAGHSKHTPGQLAIMACSFICSNLTY